MTQCSPRATRQLTSWNTRGILFVGGTILGTSNKGRFAAKTGHGEVRRVPEEILGEAKRNFDALGLRRVDEVEWNEKGAAYYVEFGKGLLRRKLASACGVSWIYNASRGSGALEVY